MNINSFDIILWTIDVIAGLAAFATLYRVSANIASAVNIAREEDEGLPLIFWATIGLCNALACLPTAAIFLICIYLFGAPRWLPLESPYYILLACFTLTLLLPLALWGYFGVRNRLA